MPGGYPPVPSKRLAYDLDGTQIARRKDDSFDLVYNSTTTQDLNNETSNRKISETSVSFNYFFTWLFAEQKDLYGVWASGDSADGNEKIFGDISYSKDAHTWNDGTWTDTGLNFTARLRFWDTWRFDVKTFSASDVWAFRGRSQSRGGLDFEGVSLYHVHIYGDLAASVTTRILLIDKDTGSELDLHDWGYLPRGTTKEKVIQVKNNSSTLTANTVTLGFDSLNSSNPDAWHAMKDGAGSYASSLSLGDIAPGATYTNDITVRVVVPGSPPDNLGPFTNRLTIDVASWS